MKMLRHYFVSSNLDDLETFEEQLENAGITDRQIHVLSKDVAVIEQHRHLHVCFFTYGKGFYALGNSRSYRR